MSISSGSFSNRNFDPLLRQDPDCAESEVFFFFSWSSSGTTGSFDDTESRDSSLTSDGLRLSEFPFSDMLSSDLDCAKLSSVRCGSVIGYSLLSVAGPFLLAIFE